MADQLRSLLGLPEADINGVTTVSDAARTFRENFTKAIETVNGGLRIAATRASSDEHRRANSQREKVFVAYQKVLKQFDSGGDTTPDGDAQRVVAAAESLGGSTTTLASSAESKYRQWMEREANFDDMAAHVSELDDANHDKAATLQKLVDGIREQVGNRSYAVAVETYERVAEKVKTIYDQYISDEDLTTAETAAPTVRTVPGGGGYEYEQHSDGSIFIVNSPKVGRRRTEVEKGSKGFQAILQEIGPFPQTEESSEVPTGSSEASPMLDSLMEVGGAAVDKISDAAEGVADFVGDATSSIADGVSDFLGIGDGGEPSFAQPAEQPAMPTDVPTEDVPDIMGGAETETEKKLAEFTEAMQNVQVEVDGKMVSVRPPYHWNQKDHKIRLDAEKARRENPKVNAILKRVFGGDNKDFGKGAKTGKASPEQMQKFLEESLKAGLIKEKSAQGMKDYLDKYGVSTDCSGLVVQALNFLEDGNTSYDSDDEIKLGDYVNTTKMAKFDYKVTDPKQLRAGDAMVKGGSHVRLITDVDCVGNSVEFTTLESTASKVSEHGSGVGERRWRFPDASDPKRLELKEGGEFKPTGKGKGYKYTRHDSLVKQQEAEQESGAQSAVAAPPVSSGSPSGSTTVSETRQEARQRLTSMEQGLRELAEKFGVRL